MAWKMKRSGLKLLLGTLLFIGMATLLGGVLIATSNLLPLVIVFIYLSFLFIGGIKGTRYFKKIQFFRMRNLWNTIKLVKEMKMKNRIYMYGIIGFSVLFASETLVKAFITGGFYVLTVGVISFVVWEISRYLLKTKKNKQVVPYLTALKQGW